jgi:hypothetical protein
MKMVAIVRFKYLVQFFGLVMECLEREGVVVQCFVWVLNQLHSAVKSENFLQSFYFFDTDFGERVA